MHTQHSQETNTGNVVLATNCRRKPSTPRWATTWDQQKQSIRTLPRDDAARPFSPRHRHRPVFTRSTRRHRRPYLLSIENPEPPLELVRVHASVERVVRLLVLRTPSEVARGRALPSAECRVRLVPRLALHPKTHARKGRVLHVKATNIRCQGQLTS